MTRFQAARGGGVGSASPAARRIHRYSKLSLSGAVFGAIWSTPVLQALTRDLARQRFSASLRGDTPSVLAVSFQ
jgi:hypothetical protein